MRLAALLTASLTGCATVSTFTPPPPAPPVEVILDAPVSDAFDRAAAALVAQGFTIDQADRSGGTIKTAGVPGGVAVASGMAVATATSTLYYRATILPHEGGSRVLLNATGRMSMTSGGRTDTTEESPLSTCPEGNSEVTLRCQEGYQKIQTTLREVAARIRGS